MENSTAHPGGNGGRQLLPIWGHLVLREIGMSMIQHGRGRDLFLREGADPAGVSMTQLPPL